MEDIPKSGLEPERSLESFTHHVRQPARSATSRAEDPHDAIRSGRLQALQHGFQLANPVIKPTNPLLKATNPLLKAANPLLKAANSALKLLYPTLKLLCPALKLLYLLLSCANGSSCLYEWKTTCERFSYAAEHRAHGSIKIRGLLGLEQALGPASAGSFLPTSLPLRMEQLPLEDGDELLSQGVVESVSDRSHRRQ
jgi:hypothetical protein